MVKKKAKKRVIHFDYSKDTITETTKPDTNLEPQSSDIQASDSHSIEQKYKAYAEKRNQLKPYFQKIELPFTLLDTDIIIHRKIQEKEKILRELKAVIQDTNKTYKMQKEHADYHQDLEKKFDKAIQLMNSAIDELFSIDQSIKERIERIPVGTDDHEMLKVTLKKEYDQLKSAINSYCEHLARIDISNDLSNHDQNFFVSQITGEINDLCTSLELYYQMGDIRTSEISHFREKLLNHIGVSASLLPKFGTLPRLNSIEIQILIDKLLPDLVQTEEEEYGLMHTVSSLIYGVESKTDVLKAKIVRISSLSYGITQLSIKKYARYFDLRNTEIELINHNNKLKYELDIELLEYINEFQKKILFLSYDDDEHCSGNRYTIEETKKVLQQIDDLNNQLEKLPTKIILSDEADAKHSHQIIARLEYSINKNQEVYNTLMLLQQSIQSKTIKHQLKVIENQIKLNLQEINNNLMERLEHAREALLAAKIKPHTDLDKSEALRNELLTYIDTKPLAAIRIKASEIIVITKEKESLARAEIQGQHSKNYNRTCARCSMAIIPELHPVNPFAAKLKKAHENVKQLKKEFRSHYASLEHLEGKMFKSWIKTYQNKERQLSLKNTRRIELLDNANEIERRLSNNHYQIAVASIKKINEEIARINTLYIPAAIKNATGEADEDAAFVLNTVLKQDISLQKKIAPQFLDLIDTRLKVLINLRKQFADLNQQYINEDLTKLDDERFKEALLTIVAVELLNDHMEVYSEGRRNQLIQWIRVSILKPMMTLSYQAHNQIAPYFRGQNIRFFVTPFATQTEYEMATYGHKLAEELSIESTCIKV